MTDAKTTPCCGPGCCDDGGSTTTAEQDKLRDQVREGYGEIARAGQWSSVPATASGSSATEAPAAGCCGGATDGAIGGGCCGPTTLTPEQVALAVGYAADDLTVLPDGANMGLSCGNPTALASLGPGETVIDLGAGGGFDCFIAGPRVGATGCVIGIDMTPEMLSKARGNLGDYREQSNLDNVEFRLGEIEHMPVGDDQADVVISNCVINLSPDKDQVWREMFRVLKPGGRVAVSDLALLQPLPAAIKADVDALVGCVAGAQLVDELRADINNAGFGDLQMTAKPQYIEAMMNQQDPLYARIAGALPEGTTVGDYVVSLDIEARKPKGCCC